MIGPALKVSIQTTHDDVSETEYYFPSDKEFTGNQTTWCNVFDKKERCFDGGSKRSYPSEINSFSVHLRSGYMIPLHDAQALNITTS